jgi:hypothetical protein
MALSRGDEPNTRPGLAASLAPRRDASVGPGPPAGAHGLTVPPSAA